MNTLVGGIKNRKFAFSGQLVRKFMLGIEKQKLPKTGLLIWNKYNDYMKEKKQTTINRRF